MAKEAPRPEYYSWRDMKRRCQDKKCPSYPDYGGRGIKVCRRWQKFGNFLADMGKRPSRFHTLGRIDNNGDYRPENCEWLTQKEQGNNRRNSLIVRYRGVTMTLTQAVELAGIVMFGTARRRILSGWRVSHAVEFPPMPGRWHR